MTDIKILHDVESVLLKRITAYEVRGQTDTTEGRGGTYLVGYFFNKSKADEAAKDKGVWGAAGDVHTVNVVELTYPQGFKVFYLDKPIDVKSATNEELKAKALAKLTTEDKLILGIKD